MSGDDKPQCFVGAGGAKCSMNDIFKATSVSNSIDDMSGWGNQVAAGVMAATGKVPFACAAKNITGPCPTTPAPVTPTPTPTPIPTPVVPISSGILKPWVNQPNYSPAPAPFVMPPAHVLPAPIIETPSPMLPPIVGVGHSPAKLQQILNTQGEAAFNNAKVQNTFKIAHAQNIQRLHQQQQQFMSKGNR
jgi:hypothetical protein